MQNMQVHRLPQDSLPLPPVFWLCDQQRHAGHLNAGVIAGAGSDSHNAGRHRGLRKQVVQYQIKSVCAGCNFVGFRAMCHDILSCYVTAGGDSCCNLRDIARRLQAHDTATPGCGCARHHRTRLYEDRRAPGRHGRLGSCLYPAERHCHQSSSRLLTGGWPGFASKGRHNSSAASAGGGAQPTC